MQDLLPEALRVAVSGIGPDEVARALERFVREDERRTGGRADGHTRTVFHVQEWEAGQGEEWLRLGEVLDDLARGARVSRWICLYGVGLLWRLAQRAGGKTGAEGGRTLVTRFTVRRTMIALLRIASKMLDDKCAPGDDWALVARLGGVRVRVCAALSRRPAASPALPLPPRQDLNVLEREAFLLLGHSAHLSVEEYCSATSEVVRLLQPPPPPSPPLPRRRQLQPADEGEPVVLPIPRLLLPTSTYMVPPCFLEPPPKTSAAPPRLPPRKRKRPHMNHDAAARDRHHVDLSPPFVTTLQS